MVTKPKATAMHRFKPRTLSLAVKQLFEAAGARRFGWGALAALPGLALAGPTGEQVVAGSVSVVRPDGQHTRVDQSSQNAVVNWNEFSVGGDEYVIFNQPGATAAILNRVVGADPSAILGQISANGRVFLVNPRGVYFAPGARVDVAALTATVLDINDDDFMSGRYVFTKPEHAPAGATVRNDGTIEAGPDGFVVLAGDYTNNSGVIAGQLGTVVLASGSQVTLQLGDDGLINFAVNAEVLSGLAGVENVGSIAADGGRVLMTAKVAEGLVATAVNNAGLVRAQSIVEENGEVFLRAAGGDIAQAGVIDVSGAAGQSGGRVIITSDNDIHLAADSIIDADGSAGGNGGQVRVIADGTLDFRRDALITAHAGAEGATGGRVELSGHETVRLEGSTDLGPGGEVLVDPATLYFEAGGSAPGSYGSVTDVGVDFVSSLLNAGTDVTLYATATVGVSGTGLALNATGSGDLAVRIGMIEYGTSSGSLSGPHCSVGLCSGGGSVEFVPGSWGNIDLSGMSIAIKGNLLLQAGEIGGSVKTATLGANSVAINAGVSASSEAHAEIETGAITAVTDVALLAGNVNTTPTVITTGNIVSGRDITVQAEGPGAHITVGDATAADDIGIYALAGKVTANKLVTTGLAGEETNFAITVRGLTTSGSINVADDVIANGLNTTIEFQAKNIHVGGDTKANAGANARVRMYGNTTIGIIDLDGSVQVSGGNSGEVLAQGRQISFGGGITINANTGDASLSVPTVNSEVDITGNVTVKSTNDAALIEIGGVDVAIAGDVLASAGTSAWLSIWTESNGTDAGNLTINGKVTAIGSSAGIYLYGSNGDVSVTGALVAQGDYWSDVDLWSTGDITVGSTITAAGGEASIELSASGDIDITGHVRAAGSSASIDIWSYDGGAVTLSGGVTASASAYDAEIDIDANTGAVTITGDVKAIAQDDSRDAEININGGAITINGSVLADAGSSASIQLGNSYGYFSDGFAIDSGYSEQAYSSSGSFPNVQVSGSVTVHAGGEEGAIRIYADTVNVGGAVVADASSYASIDVRAINDITVHAVTATGSEASISFEGRNITIDGAMTATSVPVGMSETTTGSDSWIWVEGTGNVTFNGSVRASNVAGIGGISVRTAGAGMVEGDFVVLGLQGGTGGLVDARTKTGSGVFGGEGLIDLHIDNSAYTGDAMFSFGSDEVSDRNFNSVALRSGGSLAIDPFSARSLSIDVPGRFIAVGAITIAGGGTLPIQPTDQYLFDSMTNAGLTPPNHGPDLLIRATQGISFLSSLSFSHMTPYLKLFSNGSTTMPSSVGGVSGAEFTVVYAPIDPTLPVLFEATPFTAPSGSVGYNAVNHFASIPGTTIAFGEGTDDGMVFTGPITIGAGGTIDLGDDNFLVLTDGAVVGLGNVISTGRIVQVGRASYSPLEVPVIDEFNEDQESADSDDDDDDEAIAELTGEDSGADEDIVEESNVGQLECSA